MAEPKEPPVELEVGPHCLCAFAEQLNRWRRGDLLDRVDLGRRDAEGRHGPRRLAGDAQRPATRREHP